MSVYALHLKRYSVGWPARNNKTIKARQWSTLVKGDEQVYRSRGKSTYEMMLKQLKQKPSPSWTE